MNIIKNRALSNLYKNTDQEINDCLDFLKKKYDNNNIEIIFEFILYKLCKKQK
jgi:hypothetical protein